MLLLKGIYIYAPFIDLFSQEVCLLLKHHGYRCSIMESYLVFIILIQFHVVTWKIVNSFEQFLRESVHQDRSGRATWQKIEFLYILSIVSLYCDKKCFLDISNINSKSIRYPFFVTIPLAARIRLFKPSHSALKKWILFFTSHC